MKEYLTKGTVKSVRILELVNNRISKSVAVESGKIVLTSLVQSSTENPFSDVASLAELG